jgi:hypothetical protein
MSDSDKQMETAEQRAQALKEMGLEDPEDWEREDHTIICLIRSNATQRNGGRSPNQGPQIKEGPESKPHSKSICLESSEQASTITFRFANACGNVKGYSTK